MPMAATNQDFRLFAGQVTHTLDSKNRVTVPSRWRVEGDGEFYALPDPNKKTISLLLPLELQKLMEETSRNADLKGSKARTFLRNYFSQAFPCPVDKQGRVVIPAEMCDKADLSEEVILAGTGSRIEVWSPANWELEKEQSQEIFQEVANELGI